MTLKLAMTLMLVLGLSGSALAIDQPPETAPQQRAWLLSHLVTDMQSVGSFTGNDIAQMVMLVNALTDDQASLLARFYCLTREKTEQDARLYAVQQTESEEALAQANSQVADVLPQLGNKIQQTYSELATIMRHRTRSTRPRRIPHPVTHGTSRRMGRECRRECEPTPNCDS